MYVMMKLKEFGVMAFIYLVLGTWYMVQKYFPCRHIF